VIKFKKLDHIQLCIPKGEEAQARLFYSEILGLKEIQKPDALLKPMVVYGMN
jgi:4-hydroxyphenylpyruvate dioxygenase-like putative hemolysin